MRETLVYLLYGNSRTTHLELSFSILSAVQKAAQRPDILLVTDEANRRADLPVEHRFFTDEEFDRWTLGGTYHHAAKVGALTAVVEEFGGKIAMIDTDTYFLDDPARLFERIEPGVSVMHADEGTLAEQNGYWDRIIAADDEVTIDSRMFNSGVIGIHETDGPLLKAVVPLMRRLNQADPEVHNVEQFALGQVLPNVRTSDDLLRHYWGYGRPFTHARLEAMFPAFTAEIFERNLHEKHEVEGFPPRRKLNLVRAKLKQLQRRQSDTYRFAYLAYLQGLTTRNAIDAECWMTVARDAIRYNKWPERLIEADFSRLNA